MKKTIQLSNDSNAFTVKIGGTPSSTSILSDDGNLLRRSLVKSPHQLTHLCPPGRYHVETDGEIVDIEETRITISPVLPDIDPDNLDQVYETAEWNGIDDEGERLGYIKEALIQSYSARSFQLRDELIPDYKLQNAALGIYDKKTVATFSATVQGFRQEFKRLEKAIVAAKTLTRLKSIKAKFPDNILSPE